MIHDDSFWPVLSASVVLERCDSEHEGSQLVVCTPVDSPRLGGGIHLRQLRMRIRTSSMTGQKTNCEG